jgi:hypothetical protein
MLRCTKTSPATCPHGRRSELSVVTSTIHSRGRARANATRPLTHSSELSREGLAVDATHEEWQSVVGAELGYEVSTHGRVRSIDRIVLSVSKSGKLVQTPHRGKLLNPVFNNYGYLTVWIRPPDQVCKRRRMQIHRLVTAAFVGPCPAGMEVCHNDGDRSNNHLWNLRYDTRSGNHLDKVRHGTSPLLRTHCSNGHELSGDNLKVTFDGNKVLRRCRRCSGFTGCGQGHNRLKTHCKHGHEFTPENTVIVNVHRGWRKCRECQNRWGREQYWKNRPPRR